MQEIVPDVFTWSRLSERHGYTFNGHLVRQPGGNLCIDPVEPDEADLDHLLRLGAARILLTNRNHTRAAGMLRSRLGARIAIDPRDADYARGQGATIDDDLSPGQRIGDLEIIELSGKSPGEVALFWPERRLLIVGDAVIGNPPGECSLLPAKVMDDPSLLARNLRTLLALDVETLLVGDGVSILTGARERLSALVDRLAEVP